MTTPEDILQGVQDDKSVNVRFAPEALLGRHRGSCTTGFLRTEGGMFVLTINGDGDQPVDIYVPGTHFAEDYVDSFEKI